MSAAADRNLLFGILALQLDFISREQLIGGMQNWVLAKDQPLADILWMAGALSADDRATLEAVVARHLHNHQDDPQQSLAAVGSISSIQQELTRLSDQELAASLPQVAAKPQQEDPFATTSAKPASEGRFQILRPHAEGGLGKVFVARDAELNREVALKEIQPHYAHDSYARARFTLEAEITGRLEHPGIVPVYGLGTYADGRPYYAMRFIRGESLKEAIARFHDAERRQASDSERAVELRQLLGRFIDVCQAVQYAHDRGVLHRDLKPANVMLGKYGETLVVDWGLAKAEGKNVETPSLHEESQLVPASGSEVEPTQMGTMVGTLQYMSPEQAIGRMDLIGPATDVFALGATLYHLLTGQAPYQAKSRDELVSAVREGRFPSPRQINKSVAPPLESVCLRALAADPADRYASAGEMLQDVERWLAEEPVRAHRESFSERMHRWRRQNPNLVSGVRAALVIGILGLCCGAMVMRNMNNRLALSNGELEEVCRRAYLSMQEANQERERSRQTIRFLSTALGKLDAGENGKQIPAATLLSRAMQQADAEFPDDQELKSRVSEILTTAMQGLGLAEETLAMHHRELHEMSKHCSTHDPKVKDCVNDLANAYLAAGRDAEAIAVLEKHALNKPATVTPVSFKPQPRLPGAQPASSQAVAKLHAEIDRHAEQAAVDLDVADPLTTLDRHASTHLAKGQWDQAFPLKEAAIRISTAQAGRKCEATARRLNELAQLYAHAHRTPRALELSEEALRIKTELLGAKNPTTWLAMETVGNAYRLAGRLDEAVPLLEKTARLLVSQNPTASSSLECLGLLALAYRDAGRLQDAHKLATAVLNSCTKQLGDDHELTLTTAFHLATIQVLQGDTAAAIPLCEQTIAKQTRILGAEHPDTLSTQLWLAAAHTRAKELSAAEEQLLQLNSALEQSSLGSRWQCLSDNLQFLAELYDAWQQPAEAAKWRTRLTAWQRENQ